MVAIPLTVLMIVYGALMMMFTSGSEDRVSKSKKIITSAIIGLVIALSAWILVNTLLHVLTGDVNFPWDNVQCFTE